jgi:hypothetical protein
MTFAPRTDESHDALGTRAGAPPMRDLGTGALVVRGMTHSGSRTFISALAGALLLLAALIVGTASSGVAASRWAPESSAKITPGVQMVTQGAQCTGNFVFTDGAGRTYVGYAAHCAGKGSSTDTNGCKTASYPIGTPVTFESNGNVVTGGTTVGHGTLAYSSWITEHKLGTTNANTCSYNDLALVRVNSGDVGKVNPTVPQFGGPTGVRSTGFSAGDQVYSYGNSELRGGVTQFSPKYGVSTGDEGAGWSHDVLTFSPGVPGDSGSGLLDAQGRASGVLSTVELAPVPAQNAFGDLSRELAFAQQHSGIGGLRLVKGTRGFSAN